MGSSRQGLLVLAALTVAIFSVGCSHSTRTKANVTASLSDLRYIQELVEAAHPAPFFHESRLQFERSIDKIEATTTAHTTAESLYRRLAPALAELGDAHTGLDPYTNAYQRFRGANGLLFPLELRVVERRAFVMANYEPEQSIPLGSELASVDGLPMSTYLDRLGRYVGAERVALRDSFVAQDIRAYMWHADMLAPFTVAFYTPTGRKVTVILHGATVAAIHAWDNSNAGYEALTPFRLQYVARGSVGVLTIHSFDNPDGWRDFPGRLVGDLKKHRARALLIDLRENAGGGTEASDALLSLLAHQRFRDFSEANIKVSAATKSAYGKDRYIDIYGSDAWDAPDGSLLRQTVDWKNPIASQSAFPGRVYVLIGSGTFSTAAIFAAAAQDCHVATILGEESGGLPTLYGESFSFNLPALGLEGTVSTKFFVRPNGDRSSRGVIPDHPIAATAPDAPSDPELAAAITYALKHS